MSDLANEFQIQPSQIHGWVKLVLDQAEAAFQRQAGNRRARRGQGPSDRPTGREARPEERGHRRADGGERPRKKSQWGTLKGRWVPHDTRDEVVDYVRHWNERTELSAKQLGGLAGHGRQQVPPVAAAVTARSTSTTAWIPRDWWLEDWEKQAILRLPRSSHPLEGYRRLAFMMLDDDVVAVSPTQRLPRAEGGGPASAGRWASRRRKARVFVQPDAGPRALAHRHQLREPRAARSTYLTTILDGYSRYIVHWEIRETMKEATWMIVVQRALEKFPGEHPRIISDNGPQFVARDFKEFIRLVGLTHVRTSPYYPQSNGKLERWHGTIKGECIRPACPAVAGRGPADRGPLRRDTTTRSACTARSATSPRPTSSTAWRR